MIEIPEELAACFRFPNFDVRLEINPISVPSRGNGWVWHEYEMLALVTYHDNGMPSRTSRMLSAFLELWHTTSEGMAVQLDGRAWKLFPDNLRRTNTRDQMGITITGRSRMLGSSFLDGVKPHPDYKPTPVEVPANILSLKRRNLIL